MKARPFLCKTRQSLGMDCHRVCENSFGSQASPFSIHKALEMVPSLLAPENNNNRGAHGDRQSR